ncbi:hypothetical protein PCANC_04103 [Puccinia coronata f. sp. avenae]|uniref:Uncharacterized protein n=1 Tax=Puccinia coronata f. sp. avenae TaxID=200324 RepID=A0A2N5W270_9BASI|nr:hypothetical protein PCANC_04103 [Puccinia coronata f. sp. avenae]
MSLAKILVAFQLLHCLVQSRPLSSSPDLVKRGIGGVFHFAGTSTGLSKEGEAMEKSDDWISTLDQAASWLLGFNSHAREGVPNLDLGTRPIQMSHLKKLNLMMLKWNGF